MLADIKVTVKSAVIYKTYDDGSNDDPFIQVKIGQVSKKTLAMTNTTVPEWNETLPFEHVEGKDADTVWITLWHSSAVINDIIGRNSISISQYINKGPQSISVTMLDEKGIDQATVEIVVDVGDKVMDDFTESEARAPGVGARPADSTSLSFSKYVDVVLQDKEESKESKEGEEASRKRKGNEDPVEYWTLADAKNRPSGSNSSGDNNNSSNSRGVVYAAPSSSSSSSSSSSPSPSTNSTPGSIVYGSSSSSGSQQSVLPERRPYVAGGGGGAASGGSGGGGGSGVGGVGGVGGSASISRTSSGSYVSSSSYTRTSSTVVSSSVSSSSAPSSSSTSSSHSRTTRDRGPSSSSSSSSSSSVSPTASTSSLSSGSSGSSTSSQRLAFIRGPTSHGSSSLSSGGAGTGDESKPLGRRPYNAPVEEITPAYAESMAVKEQIGTDTRMYRWLADDSLAFTAGEQQLTVFLDFPITKDIIRVETRFYHDEDHPGTTADFGVADSSVIGQLYAKWLYNNANTCAYYLDKSSAKITYGKSLKSLLSAFYARSGTQLAIEVDMNEGLLRFYNGTRLAPSAVKIKPRSLHVGFSGRFAQRFEAVSVRRLERPTLRPQDRPEVLKWE